MGCSDPPEIKRNPDFGTSSALAGECRPNAGESAMFLKDFFMAQHDGARALAGAGVIGMHLVSGPLVGFAIGYALDCWLDTGPLAGLIGLIIGIAAGFLNVYRDSVLLVKKMDKKPGAAGRGGRPESPVPVAPARAAGQNGPRERAGQD